MSSSSPAPNPPPQSTWDKILGSLPVILTVLATLLAGLSSSEMTQAQYHRSLAAQYQSKAGDQWNFFQAKRQRGAIVAGQADTLRAELILRAETHFLPRVAQLEASLRRTAQRTEQLRALRLLAAGSDRFSFLFTATEQLRKEATEQAEQVKSKLTSVFAPPEPRDLLEKLSADHLRDPRKELLSELANVHADLPAALKVIDARRPESEVAVPLTSVTMEHLREAIDLVEKRAAELDRVLAPVVDRLNEANKALAEQADRLRPFHGAVRTTQRELEEPNVEKDAANLRSAAEAVLLPARHAAATLGEMVRGAQLLRNEFNERRYESEARYNQVVAWLYEARVSKSNLAADRHRQRSYQFFYAMLAAQAGVTMATFALAVRQMSALWGLASLAGLAALAAGVYVYWFV